MQFSLVGCLFRVKFYRPETSEFLVLDVVIISFLLWMEEAVIICLARLAKANLKKLEKQSFF